MIDLNDIRSLTDFQRNVKMYTKRLSKTGRPMVLTVNGKPGFVVQDAQSYQALLSRLFEMEEASKLNQAVTDAIAGNCKPAKPALESIARKHGFKI